MNCLYNGVELPAMPESELPHAYIYHVASYGIALEHYVLVFTSEPFYDYSSDGSYSIGHRVGDVKYVVYTGESAWGYEIEYDAQGVQNPVDSLVWANFDVPNEDGTLYLAASEPVPTSSYTPNPTNMAMALGMLMGMTLRRMRGMKLPEEEKTPVE